MRTVPNVRSLLMSAARASIGATISILSRRRLVTIFSKAAKSSECASRYGRLPSSWYFSTYHIFSCLQRIALSQLRTKHERRQEGASLERLLSSVADITRCTRWSATGQNRPPALQERLQEVGPSARCNPFPCDPDRDTLPARLGGWPMRRREFIAGLGGAAATW